MYRAKLKTITMMFCMCASTATFAADFTFNIPIRAENVPSVQTLYVDCYVSRVRTTDPYPAGGSNVVGRGGASARVVGGRFNGTIRVEINASGINPASSARSYSCTMRAVGTAQTGATYTASSGNFADVYQRATGHTLASYNVRVRGNF